MNTTQIGRLGENKALKYLKKNKYRLVDRNVHISHNEIDIIVKNREYIVFVEVKTRSFDKELYSDYGTPASAVDRNKIRRTVDAARGFLCKSRYEKLQPRFDVIEVYLDKQTHKVLKINHIENAFDAYNGI